MTAPMKPSRKYKRREKRVKYLRTRIDTYPGTKLPSAWLREYAEAEARLAVTPRMVSSWRWILFG